MQNINFLFAAYTLIWIAIFLFLLRLAKKVTRLEQELQRIGDK